MLTGKKMVVHISCFAPGRRAHVIHDKIWYIRKRKHENGPTNCMRVRTIHNSWILDRAATFYDECLDVRERRVVSLVPLASKRTCCVSKRQSRMQVSVELVTQDKPMPAKTIISRRWTALYSRRLHLSGQKAVGCKHVVLGSSVSPGRSRLYRLR